LQNNKTQTNPQTANHTPCSRSPVRRRAHDSNNLSGPSSSQPQHPSSKLPSRSRARRRTTNLRLARGLCAPSSESPPARSRATRPLEQVSASVEGYAPPRASLHLARGLRGFVTHGHTHSPDRSIKCSDTPWAPGSKANPHHADPLTPPGNRIPALFRQPFL
jgi:hypothetical protein